MRTPTGSFATRRRVALGGAAAAVSLAACGPGGEAGSPVNVDKPVSLIVQFPQPGQAGSENHAAFFLRETGAFQGANPNVKITSEPSAGNDKLQAAVVAGSPPDMTQAHAPGKKPAAFVAINGLFVFRQPKDLARTRAAMRFGYHLTDTPAQKSVTPIQSLPVRRSAGNIYPDDVNLTTALATVDNARDLGRFSTNGEVRQLWLKAIQAAFTQQQSARVGMEEFCRLADPVIARA